MENLVLVITIAFAAVVVLFSWRAMRAAQRASALSTDTFEASLQALDGVVLWCDEAMRIQKFSASAPAILGEGVKRNASVYALLRSDAVAPMRAIVDGLRQDMATHADVPASVGWQSVATPPAALQGHLVRVAHGARTQFVLALHEPPPPPTTIEMRGEAAPDVVVQIAHGIAHEFNNLLTTISGRAEMAMANDVGGTAGRIDLDEIRSAAAKASALARRLLILSDAHALQPRILDTNTFVADLMPTLRQLAGSVPVRVVAGEDAGSINADPVRLRQVVVALVQNAVEALRESGTEITIRTERRRSAPRGASVATDAKADYAVIMVQDDGPGLSADARSRLFEPYFTTKEAKSGLGLVTAYGIARQSGGTLDVYSAPGRGTTITIWLPRVSDDAELPLTGRLRPLAEPLLHTVLVVEDEESVRRLVRVVLEREGYRVLQAANGVEALRLLDDPDLSLDLLLTDVMMPQMGGRELAERLLAVQPDITVIFMSGYVADRASLTGVAERKAPLLQKPFAIDELVRVVRSAIDAAKH